MLDSIHAPARPPREPSNPGPRIRKRSPRLPRLLCVLLLLASALTAHTEASRPPAIYPAWHPAPGRHPAPAPQATPAPQADPDSEPHPNQEKSGKVDPDVQATPDDGDDGDSPGTLGKHILGTHIQEEVDGKVKAKLQSKNIGSTPDADDDDFNFGSLSLGKQNHAAEAADPRNLQAAPFGDRLDLTRSWLLHAGAAPDAASPQFNDAAWQAVDTSDPLVTQGFFNLNEVWYRVHIHLAPGTHDLAVTLADFGGSYRVYANGLELGGHGRMSDRGDYIFPRSATFPIPDSALAAGPAAGSAAGSNLVLAIHAFVGTVDRVSFTLRDGISPRSAVFLGPANTLWRDQQFYFSNGLSEGVGILTLWAVLLILTVALSFLIPRVAAYPLLAVYAGGHLFSYLLADFCEFHYIPRNHWLGIPINLGLLLSELAALEFCRIIASVGRRRWFIAFEIFYVLSYLTLLLSGTGIFSYAIYGAVEYLSYYLLLTAIFFLILVGVRRHRQDAYILAGFGVLYVLYFALWKGLHYVDFFYPWLTALAQGFMLHLQPGAIGDLAVIAAFLSVVVVRTLRLVGERAAIANEIEAARTMQQLLLARSAEPIPGFLVETAYLPAGEVGGDFFLVSPCTSPAGETSLTAIVGDVSGKGLRAAMRVSMILGVLRREPSREPAAMLHALNEALHADGELGFTTACCVRLFADGRFSASNAGHIPPFLASPGDSRSAQSQEISTPPALPLGLAPDQTYEVVEGRLLPGQRLVLLSDGVPEARSPKGELFGFDRLLPLTLKPAATIAQTAQNFGQEDDITVLTLTTTSGSTRQPPPPPRLAGLGVPPPPAPPLTVAPASPARRPHPQGNA